MTINKHLHKFFFIPFLFISALLLLGSITACVCSTVEAGQKVPVYLVFKDNINPTNSTVGWNEKTAYSSQILKKAQDKQKIASYQINFLKKVFTVANHQWFFGKNPDYKTTEFYKQLNQQIKANSAEVGKDKKTIKEFFKEYLSKKNNFFKYILVFLDTWNEKGGLIINKKVSHIRDFLFTESKKENKAAPTTKDVDFPKVVLQFTNRWRIILNIKKITLKINNQSFTVNGQTYYQSSFKSLKKAKLDIEKIVDLNS